MEDAAHSVIDECFEKKQEESDRVVDRHSMLHVLQFQLVAARTCLLLLTIISNVLLRQEESTHQSPAVATRTTAAWTRARETPTNSTDAYLPNALRLNYLGASPSQLSPTRSPPSSLKTQVSDQTTKQAQGSGLSTSGAPRGNAPATASPLHPPTAYTRPPRLLLFGI